MYNTQYGWVPLVLSFPACLRVTGLTAQVPASSPRSACVGSKMLSSKNVLEQQRELDKTHTQTGFSRSHERDGESHSPDHTSEMENHTDMHQYTYEQYNVPVDNTHNTYSTYTYSTYRTVSVYLFI